MKKLVSLLALSAVVMNCASAVADAPVPDAAARETVVRDGLGGFAFNGTSCRIYDLLGPDGGQVWVTVDGKRSAYPLARFDSYCTYHRTATLFVYDGKPGRHTVEIELDSKQPSRQPVAFRLKDPETELKGPKYNGTRFWPAKILIVGDLCE